MPLLVVRWQSRIICEDRSSNQAAAVCKVSGSDLPLADSAKATRIKIEPRRAIRLTGESLASRALLVNTSGADSTFSTCNRPGHVHQTWAEVPLSPKPMLVCNGQSLLKRGIEERYCCITKTNRSIASGFGPGRPEWPLVPELHPIRCPSPDPQNACSSVPHPCKLQ